MSRHPATVLQEAETAVRAVLEHTTQSVFQRDRRITHRLETAATQIAGARILLTTDQGGPSVLRREG